MANFASRGLDPGSTDASLARQIAEIYLTLFARKPTLREQRLGISLIRRVLSANPGPQAWDRAWRQYCQVLLCTNELIYLN